MPPASPRRHVPAPRGPSPRRLLLAAEALLLAAAAHAAPTADPAPNPPPAPPTDRAPSPAPAGRVVPATAQPPAPAPSGSVKPVPASLPLGEAPPRPLYPAGRPRIGLVLSGGGARGLAHVGVLKVLEQEHIPVDVIAGTSMGAIIGGLYASGMSAETLERELGKVDWDGLFASRVERQALSQRRKEEDFDISPVIEIGLRHGEPTLPVGSVSSRGLELLLRRYTLPVRATRQFDQLPIPFRAVATDLENGAALVLKEGDLATALRSSMSVPGVFAPTEVDGRILADGGLVNNLPVDVAREMGANVIIAVNIGTPLSRRETLGSLLGVTSQMINILTEQNVQRSLASLDATRDLLLAPPLGELTAADFARVQEFIRLGERYAQTLLPQLRRYAVTPEQWQATLSQRRLDEPPARTIAQIRFEGADISNPTRMAVELESKVGQPVNVAAAERDSRRLGANGDYLRTDYHLEDLPAGTGLVFDLEEKPWGPHYFRIGLDLNSNFAGQGDFNIKISHNRHWLNADGAEWRNRIQIGTTPRWFTEWYQPLSLNTPIGHDWFVSAYGEVERREVRVYDQVLRAPGGDSALEIGRYVRNTARLGLDVGQPWGGIGEIRLGVVGLLLRNDPQIVVDPTPENLAAQSLREIGGRIAVVVDQLDFATFPTHGYRVQAETVIGRRRAPNGVTGEQTTEDYTRIETQGTLVGTMDRHTLNLFVRALHADQGSTQGIPRYALGGFQNLSGFQPGEIEGNYLAFGRLTYHYRLTAQPVLTRGVFVGGTMEVGNAWENRSQVSLGDLRTGMSAFVGADTGIGPLYLAVTHAPRGSTGLYLFLGRP